MKKLFSLLMALMMLMTVVCSAVAEDAAQVALTVNGEEITAAEVEEYAQLLYNNGFTENVDYTQAVTYLTEETILKQKIKEFSLDQYTDDEKAAFNLDAQAQWEADIAAYVEYYLTEDTEEARAQAREDAIAYYEAYNYNQEAILDNLLLSESYTRLQNYILEGKDTAVTEEDIAAAFQEYVLQDKEMFEGNVYMYELYQMYYGYESWYQPEGFRGVTHILLPVDEALLTAWQDARALSEEAEEGAENTADVEAARQAVLDSCKEQIDAIYSRLENGESFEALIAEYGTDDGMKNEEYLKNGYAVHPDSMSYDADFVAGAFSEKVQKVGDVSDPVVSQFGIHILQYVKEIPGGPVEMTDAIHDEILEYLTSSKENSFYSEAVGGWVSASEIVVNDDVIAALSAVEETEVPAEETAE
ncbi:MAG: peptidylprolyl isomerase [Clostridia bacterium]|nr:peptidylprolyl isomerase [Clostridia bacterium]